MYINFTSHSTEKSISSSDLFNYLEKENSGFDKGSKTEEEFFFNQNMNLEILRDKNSRISMTDAIQQIDENRGTQNLKSSNFYMLNVSPSEKELRHLESVAVAELEKQGFVFSEIENNSELVSIYNEQKDELLRMQLKMYAQEVMKVYADEMDREVYANQDALPSNKERKEMTPEIDKRYTDFLQEKGLISAIEEKKSFIEINSFSADKENEIGNFFSFYSDALDKKVRLFVPTSKFNIENDRLFIEEEYYQSKTNTLLEKHEYEKELIAINSSSLRDNTDYFTDYVRNDKVLLHVNFEKFDKNLNLYFDKSKVSTENGLLKIPSKVYEAELYSAKSQFLSKEFSEEKEKIRNSIVEEKGYNLTKVINDKGEEVFLEPSKVPSKEEMQKINTLTSVKFNSFLVDNGYLEKKESSKISDWNTTKIIEASVLVESEKAKLLEIVDSRLDEPLQTWIPNFALKENENLESQSVEILKEFYDNKIAETIEAKNDTQINFIDYSEIEQYKIKFVKNTESIAFSFDVDGFSDKLEFSINKEDLYLIDGKYSIGREDFENKYQYHLLTQAKQEYKNIYTSIKEQVNIENPTEKNALKDKEIERQFKNHLIDQNILKSSERDDKYFVNAKVIESKQNSTLISYKQGEDKEDIQFWVNNKSISEKSKEGLFFKNEKEIQSLTEKAIERDLAKKEIVKIDYKNFEIEAKKHKGEEYNNIVFYQKTNGLQEPIKFSFKESELQKDGDTYLVEKYKLEYKTKNALKQGILNEYGTVKDDIKNQVWTENGFDTTKRKLEHTDLVYFGKVEKDRTYKFDDKDVLENKKIQSEIKTAEENKEFGKVKNLQSQLIKDKETGEIIKEGNVKGGLNYHTHIVVSRHDGFSKNPLDKVSMSPVANQKDSTMNHGKKVGFDRKDFREKAEFTFDKAFNYSRPVYETFSYKNTSLQNAKGKVEGFVVSNIKKEILEKSGLYEIQRELNPVRNIAKEISVLPIPTSIPKSKIDLLIKAIKLIKNVSFDKGLSH